MDSRSMGTGEQRRWKLAPLIKIRLPSRREVVCFVSLPPSLLFTIYLSLSIGRAFDLELFLESNDRYRSFLTNKETNLSNFSFPSKVYPLLLDFHSRSDFRETFESTNFIVVFEIQVFETSRWNLDRCSGCFGFVFHRGCRKYRVIPFHLAKKY